MKKYFPIIFFIMTFTGFLSGQIIFDWLDLNAELSTQKKSLYAHYESALHQSEFKTFKGKKINGKEIKSPVVILNFWASWCQPCIEEFPSIVKLKSSFPDEKVLVIGVNSDEEDQGKMIKKSIKEHKLNFPIVPDKNSEILNKFLISKIPVSIIYHNGKVVEVSNGAKDFSSEEFIEDLKSYLKI